MNKRKKIYFNIFNFICTNIAEGKFLLCSPRLHLFNQQNINIKYLFSASLLQSSVHDPSEIISDYHQCWNQLCCFISGFFDE